MFYWFLLAVVLTTAFIIYILFKMKQRELIQTQELLLQFIEQFEEQYQQLASKVEEQNDKYEQQYHDILRLLNSQNSLTTESSIDPLHLQERFHPILMMMQDGKSIEEIARSTGKGKGEVTLILELLKKESSMTTAQETKT